MHRLVYTGKIGEVIGELADHEKNGRGPSTKHGIICRPTLGEKEEEEEERKAALHVV